MAGRAASCERRGGDKAGRSAHEEGWARSGTTEWDEHQAGEGLPGMGEQTSLPEIKELSIISQVVECIPLIANSYSVAVCSVC